MYALFLFKWLYFSEVTPLHKFIKHLSTDSAQR